MNNVETTQIRVGMKTAKHRKLPQTTANLVQPYLTCLPQTTANYRKPSPALPYLFTANYRKLPQTTANLVQPYLTCLPQTTANYRKLPQT